MTSGSLAETVKQTAGEMLEKLGFEAEIEVVEREEGLGVEIKASDPGILIGYHGEILNSFQHLLKLVVYRKTGEWPFLVVDTADYRGNREKILRSMVDSAIERVRLSGKAFALPPLSSYERRVVHLILTREEGVVSESEGEGRERRVVVKPRGNH